MKRIWVNCHCTSDVRMHTPYCYDVVYKDFPFDMTVCLPHVGSLITSFKFTYFIVSLQGNFFIHRDL